MTTYVDDDVAPYVDDDVGAYVDDDMAAYMDDDAAAYMDDDVAIDVAMMTSSPYQFRDGPILGLLFQ
jgi:hypothetical protein